MIGDPGIDDRDVRIDALVIAVDRGDPVGSRTDARHAGRDGLGRQLDDLVGDDGEDARIVEHGVPLLGVEFGGEPGHGPLERPLDVDTGAVLVFEPLHDGRGVRARPEHDDVAARGIEAAGLVGRRGGGVRVVRGIGGRGFRHRWRVPWVIGRLGLVDRRDAG